MGPMRRIGKRAWYSLRKTLITPAVMLALTMIVPVCGSPSKPTNDRRISRRSLRRTGQPGRQVDRTSLGVGGPEVVW